jgi:hypothetical protein
MNIIRDAYERQIEYMRRDLFMGNLNPSQQVFGLHPHRKNK